MPDTLLTPSASTTVAAIAQRVMRLLKDLPYTDKITASYTAAGGSLTVASDATTRYEAGQYLEFFDDGSGDVHLITATAATALTTTGGQLGTTDANHSNNARFRLAPRFFYQDYVDAINAALQADLYPDLFALYETQLTPDPNNATWYSISANAEEGFRAYQKTTSTPTDLLDIDPVPQPQLVDATLSSTKRAVALPGSVLRDQSQTIFYQYAQIPAVGDLSNGMARVVELGAAWRLLAWDEGRADDDDSRRGQTGTVSAGLKARDAAFFRALQKTALDDERAKQRRRHPRRPRGYLGARHFSTP